MLFTWAGQLAWPVPTRGKNARLSKNQLQGPTSWSSRALQHQQRVLRLGAQHFLVLFYLPLKKNEAGLCNKFTCESVITPDTWALKTQERCGKDVCSWKTLPLTC